MGWKVCPTGLDTEQNDLGCFTWVNPAALAADQTDPGVWGPYWVDRLQTPRAGRYFSQSGHLIDGVLDIDTPQAARDLGHALGGFSTWSQRRSWMKEGREVGLRCL